MSIKVKVLSKKGKPLEALIQGTDVVMMNTMRRLILEEVPTMAIETVEFYDNSSAMFDEYLAHRLGLIPLTTNLKTYKLPEECCGGECAKCSVMLTLDVKGPGPVLSGDFKSKDPKVKPAVKDIPIIKLAKNQSLRLEAKAVLGKGKKHAKWQAASVGYRYVYEIEADKSLEKPGEIAKVCPHKALGVKAGKLALTEPLACDSCGECVVVSKKKVKVKPVKDSFIFTLDSKGALSNKEIISKACEVGTAKIRELEKELK